MQPQGASGPGQIPQQQQKQAPVAYAPQPVQLEKNILSDLKRKVETQMPNDEVEALAQDDDNEKVRELVMVEPEIENMQKMIDDKSKSLKDMAQANADLKTELTNRIEIYQESLTALESIEEENS